MKSPFKRKFYSPPPLLPKLAAERNLTSVEKGHAFERYVISMFNLKHFSLIEWRSDKYFEGIYPKSNGYPDLEFEIELQRVAYPFAVECKYRTNLPSNRMAWCEWHHLYNYQEFAEKRCIPVFVVFGYGGNGNLPEELYCVPLHKMKSIIIDETFLQNYKHHNLDQGFYYNTEKMELF